MMNNTHAAARRALPTGLLMVKTRLGPSRLTPMICRGGLQVGNDGFV